MSNQCNRRDFFKWTANLGLAAAVSRSVFASESTDRQSNWPIGCFTRPWDKYDYRVALDAIAEAGFKHAGLMTCNSKTSLIITFETTPEEAQQIGEEVKKRGLEVPAVYGGGFPMQPTIQTGIDALRKLIDRCAAVKGKTLMMGGVEAPELYEPYYKIISECCDYAESKKVGLTLKPHGGSNATGPQCRKSIEKVGKNNFTLWYDPGNIFYYSKGELNPILDAPSVDGIVTGMCVKDYLPPQNVMVTPGEGKVDFPAVFSLLKKGGFARGPVVIETLAPGSQAEILAQAKKAKQFVESFVG
ncbi:MAG: sugar phosphate isomerase/epimerase family protein [Candidatus Omnitrophota bacterium]